MLRPVTEAVGSQFTRKADTPLCDQTLIGLSPRPALKRERTLHRIVILSLTRSCARAQKCILQHFPHSQSSSSHISKRYTIIYEIVRIICIRDPLRLFSTFHSRGVNPERKFVRSFIANQRESTLVGNAVNKTHYARIA